MLRLFRQYYPVRNLLFVLGEGAFIYASVLIATWFLLRSELLFADSWFFLKVLLVTVVCQACLYYNDLYNFRMKESFYELGIRLLQSLGLAAILLALVYFIAPGTIIGRGIFLISICLVIFLSIIWRICYAMVINRGLFNQKIILLGSAELIKNIRGEISERLDCGYTLAAEIPESGYHDKSEEDLNGSMLCGQKYEGLSEVAKALGVKKVIAGFKEKRNSFPTKELLKCRVEGIEVIEGNSFYEMLTGKLYVRQVHPSWLIFSEGFQKSSVRRFLKRTTDLLLSFTMLLFLSPLMAVVALLIKIDSKGPVIFSQERIGEKGKKFYIHKFRSMVHNAEQKSGPVWAADNDDRVTRVGRIIRKWRIDELPQLWNVLNGEMSFVGPRPERQFFVDSLEKKIPYYKQRFTVKPGLTGWAQICYGYGASVEDAIEKLNYELFYIKNMSILLDLMIVLRTIKIVLFGKGSR